MVSPELSEAEPVKVELGKADSVAAVLGDAGGLLVDKGQKSSITMEMSMEESVTAPVSKGQRLGTLTIRAGEQILKELPLVAAEAVQRLTLGDICVRVLKRIAMAKP